MDEGSAWRLDRKLSQLVDEGFSHAEVRPEGWQVWQGGKIENRRLARLTAVLDKHRPHLDYVMQLPTAINLFEHGCQEEHLRLLQQGLKVGQHIGARLLLYQPGYRPLRPATNFVAMRELMAQERIILYQMADEAAAWGSQIAVVISDYLAVGNFTYALLPELLAQQIKALDHPQVGLCLDFSQLYLAASWCGFDYVEAVQRLLPLATHFHLQDRGGLPSHSALANPPLAQSITYLPIGWQSLCRAEVLSGMPPPASILMAAGWPEELYPLATSSLN
jgi:sugar phosphate isomerase/epimerase